MEWTADHPAHVDRRRHAVMRDPLPLATRDPLPRSVRMVVGCVLVLVAGCQSADRRTVITLWHQMPPAERTVLGEQLARFQRLHPAIRVRTLYKETEELRSGFQAAALAGTGPDLVYGPSDALGAFQTMGIVRDMTPWFPPAVRDCFVPGSLTFLPADDGRRSLVQVGDRVGNHLALVYNRRLVARPPATTDELLRLARASTVDLDGDGRTDRYGIVWNFVEPFFVVPFLTGYGAWLFADAGQKTPALDTPQSVAAYRFVLSLQDTYHVIPRNCDYETADSLFKTGKAAMIINGDWSWGDYLASDAIDAAIAPLPIVSETGLPMRPLVATKGYSLSVTATPRRVAAAIELVRFMTSIDVQRAFMRELKTLPARRELLRDPLLNSDPTLRDSALQVARARPMPVVPELRAVWDAMRPSYQALLGGAMTPEVAAATMQREAVAKIEQMNRKVRPGGAAWLIEVAAGLFAIAVLIVERKNIARLVADGRRSQLAYLMVLPALLVMALTTAFPFFYNVALSFSNMSLRHFRDWQVTGLENYTEVLMDPTFYAVLVKTIVWTTVNVLFHVGLGIVLAVAINGPVRGKAIYRILLILPWAVPAYITALTWRGMFNYEYGAINLIASHYLALPMVNWLGSPREAFLACIVTNVWLGFPFMMIITLGGLQGIPRELYEAASIDRASRPRQFFSITLPLLKPVLLPATTLGAIWTFNNLNVIWLVSNGGEPSDKTHILVSYVYKAVFNLYRYGYGAALSMIIFFLLLLFSFLFLARSRAAENVYG